MNVINENEALERTSGLLNSMILNDLEVKSGLARQCLVTFFRSAFTSRVYGVAF